MYQQLVFMLHMLLTAGGMGGMVMFNDKKYVKRALMYRDWGRIGDNSENIDDRFASDVDGIPYDYKFLYGVLGYNFKCTEHSAAFGLVQLEKFQTYKDIRRKNVERYLDNLSMLEKYYYQMIVLNQIGWQYHYKQNVG